MRVCGWVWLALLIVGSSTFGMDRDTLGRPPVAERVIPSSLHVSLLDHLIKFISDPAGSKNSYFGVGQLLYVGLDNAVDAKAHLSAFEENQSFIYALGRPVAPFYSGLDPHRVVLLRRIIVLRPSIIIVDDELTNAGSDPPCLWRFYMQNRPLISGLNAKTTVGDMGASWQTLLPPHAVYRLRLDAEAEPYYLDITPPDGSKSGRYTLDIVPSDNSRPRRFLTVFCISEAGRGVSAVHSEMNHSANQWNLTVATPERVFHLNLPPPSEGAGEIAISDAEGKVLLPERPLPSGILPHGPEGTRLLDRWDSDYRGKMPPIWDLGHPADELQRVINSGKVRACRTLDLCCGSGGDAVYLAGQKFDVTAMDVAPTAIKQAQERARRAGVPVHFLLADVLAAPSLEPFDFIYDRGCYHVVRDQNLTAYLETLQRFSHPGTEFLLLASKRGDHPVEDGSTGVTEEELNFDFLPLFNIEWLRAYRLETSQPGVLGPPAWSVLMCRKPQP
jgi:methyl halide transferase